MLIRIFELPKKFPSGFHFGNPEEVIFLEQDWFRIEGANESDLLSTPEGKAMLEKFIRGKKYFKEGCAYLVLHPKFPFTINYES